MPTGFYVGNYTKKEYIEDPFQEDTTRYGRIFSRDCAVSRMVLFKLDPECKNTWFSDSIGLFNNSFNDMPWWTGEDWKNITKEVYADYLAEFPAEVEEAKAFGGS